ncbi:hypothetical protein vBEcoMWL3_gp261 [Escherichia phage vB_EcoM_WL-3]|nr:hypothetical protein vBEcoMWL3_gp261 [Escherichia phage vB_EcoM_WL-3]
MAAQTIRRWYFWFSSQYADCQQISGTSARISSSVHL